MDNNQGGHQTNASEDAMTSAPGIERTPILLHALVEEHEFPAYELYLRNETAGQSSSCSIFKVPQALADEFAGACRPRIVSIGPYHHGEPHLQTLEWYKLRYLKALLERTQPLGIRHEDDLIAELAPKKREILQCYSESIGIFEEHAFLTMMVLDGCFIIEFLREQKRMPQARLLTNSFLVISIKRDLLRLENQVPFFVLKKLFKKTNLPQDNFSLADLALNAFAGFGQGLHNAQERWKNLKGAHLLDLFRQSLIPTNQQDNSVDESSSLIYTMRSASELYQVGIRFQKTEATTFLDIKFDERRRTIGIPNVAINDDELKWILTNMVAFEQCRGQMDGHITSYAMFMGHLIRTVDDVRLLRDRKVISNYGMSNDDFVHFFRDICKDASLDFKNAYLWSHVANLNKSLKYEGAYRCWAQLVNALRENPWRALSGLAVLVTLAGVIQTVYAVLQYYYRK